MESVSTGRRLNPRSESIDHFRTCREDFGIERNQSFKGDQGNAQFSLCCTSTAMPDDESEESTSGILFFFCARSASVHHADFAEAHRNARSRSLCLSSKFIAFR